MIKFLSRCTVTLCDEYSMLIVGFVEPFFVDSRKQSVAARAECQGGFGSPHLVFVNLYVVMLLTREMTRVTSISFEALTYSQAILIFRCAFIELCCHPVFKE